MVEGRFGPFEVPNELGFTTLTRPQRAEITDLYSLSAHVRYRKKFGARCLTLSGTGDASKAKALAMQYVYKNIAEQVTTDDDAGAAFDDDDLWHEVKPMNPVRIDPPLSIIYL